MKNRREEKAQLWFQGIPNILLHNRHPEDRVRRVERRMLGGGLPGAQLQAWLQVGRGDLGDPLTPLHPF